MSALSSLCPIPCKLLPPRQLHFATRVLQTCPVPLLLTIKQLAKLQMASVNSGFTSKQSAMLQKSMFLG
jgi:hypothetical protein